MRGISLHFPVHLDTSLIKRIPQVLHQTIALINSFNWRYPFSFPTPINAAFTLFVFEHFVLMKMCVSQHSIFINKVDLSEETVLLFGTRSLS